MKKIKFMLMALFLLIGMIMLAQDSGDSATDALKFFGLSGFWASTIVLAITVIGKLIPKRAADWMYHIEKLLHYFNEKTNRESVVEKRQRTEANRILTRSGINKKVLFIAIIMATASLSMSAQSGFSGFFKPVGEVYKTNNDVEFRAADSSIVDKGENSWLMRPYLYLNATAVDFSEDSPKTTSLQSGGIGVSYGKFSVINDQAYCLYSVNASLLTSIDIGGQTAAKIGAAVTVDVFNKLVGVGVGYINNKVMLVIPISYSF